MDTTDGRCSIVATRPPPRTNYELLIEAKRISGTDFCSTTFPVGDMEGTLIVGGYGGEVVGVGNLDGRGPDSNETTHRKHFESDTWYNVRLRVTADAIRVSIENEEIINLPVAGRKITPSVQNLAPLGVFTWGGKAVIRSIRLRQLKP